MHSQCVIFVLLLVCILLLSNASGIPTGIQPEAIRVHELDRNEYSAPAHQPKIVTKLAFGSCNRQGRAQPLWAAIQAYNPDAFVWLGDVVYADSIIGTFMRRPNSLEHMQKQYEIQLNAPEYKEFREHVPIYGVWDDHDYGENDGDYRYVNRMPSQQLFLDFIHERKDSPRRSRNGLYDSYTFGKSGKRIKLILLDTRFFQSETPGDLLSEAQWSWLEKELSFESSVEHISDDNNPKIRPDVIIIGSSIQVVPHQRIVGEGWRNFPESRTRLFHLIAKRASPSAAVLLISGDVHYGEMTRTDVWEDVVAEVAPKTEGKRIQPIVELTTSGMTHSIGRQFPNISDAILPYVFYKSSEYSASDQPSKHAFEKLCLQFNYGQVEVNWESKTIRTAIVGVDNEICSSATFRFEELSALVIPSATAQSIAADLPTNLLKWPLSSPSDDLPHRVARCIYEERNAHTHYFHISGIKTALILLATILSTISLIIYSFRHVCCSQTSAKKSKRE